VLPPGGYGTIIVTRFSGNAALQENTTSARPSATKILVNQALNAALKGTVKNPLKRATNRGMIFSLQKLVRVAQIASNQWLDLPYQNVAATVRGVSQFLSQQHQNKIEFYVCSRALKL
jgi:hypothetical protein